MIIARYIALEMLHETVSMETFQAPDPVSIVRIHRNFYTIFWLIPYEYIIVTGVYFTKWQEAFAVPNHTALTVADKLVPEVFCRLGCPIQIHSDQGREFESDLFKAACDIATFTPSFDWFRHLWPIKTPFYIFQGSVASEMATCAIIMYLFKYVISVYMNLSGYKFGVKLS
jgi:hypothetical protein